MTTITDGDVAKAMSVHLPGMQRATSDEEWEWTAPSSREWLLEMARTARRLLAPTYRDEDVERLAKTAADIIGVLRIKDYYHLANVLEDVLAPFAPPMPTPEQLRMKRGKAAHDGFYDGDTRFDWNTEDQEAWCRVADAVLEKQAEQDGEAET